MYNRFMKFIRNIFAKRKNIHAYDDGIDFQWGDRYIRAYENVPGVGGKYWRQNDDGTITQFTPRENRIDAMVNSLLDRAPSKRVSFDTVEYESEYHAREASDYVNRTDFSKVRGITANLDGNKVQIITGSEVFESTYTPARDI